MSVPLPGLWDLFSVVVGQVTIYFSLAKSAHRSAAIPSQITFLCEFCTRSLHQWPMYWLNKVLSEESMFNPLVLKCSGVFLPCFLSLGMFF